MDVVPLGRDNHVTATYRRYEEAFRLLAVLQQKTFSHGRRLPGRSGYSYIHASAPFSSYLPLLAGRQAPDLDAAISGRAALEHATIRDLAGRAARHARDHEHEYRAQRHTTWSHRRHALTATWVEGSRTSSHEAQIHPQAPALNARHAVDRASNRHVTTHAWTPSGPHIRMRTNRYLSHDGSIFIAV